MRLAEMKHGTERLSASPAAITQLTEAEQRYLQCLAAGMTFQQIAVELGWTYHQVVEFGSRFLDCDFEQRKKQDPLFSLLSEERKRYRLLLMRACNLPGTEELIRLYEESGDDKYRIAFAHLILDRLIDRLGIREKLEESSRKPN